MPQCSRWTLGASGWGQDQQYIALREYFRVYRADVVLLWATPGNDFWENAFPDRSVTPEAGHLKPTFKLRGQDLDGPYLKPQSYLHGSAIAHLLESLLAKVNHETLEQRILRRWLNELPPAHAAGNQGGHSCGGLPVIGQTDFYKRIFELNVEQSYTVKSAEDFQGSRSHFSPYLTDRSNRDEYIIAITQTLFSRIREEVEHHRSKFVVFYPVREDFDRRGMHMVRCISDSEGNRFRASLNYASLLQRVVPSKNLEIFDLPGKNEIVISGEDRHLNTLGNELAMSRLAVRLMGRGISSAKEK